VLWVDFPLQDEIPQPIGILRVGISREGERGRLVGVLGIIALDVVCTSVKDEPAIVMRRYLSQLPLRDIVIFYNLGGASSNVVGIICSPVGIGLNETPNSGWA
jgi:hypothetical protein